MDTFGTLKISYNCVMRYLLLICKHFSAHRMFVTHGILFDYFTLAFVFFYSDNCIVLYVYFGSTVYIKVYKI